MQTQTPIVLGIEGGGTKTEWVCLEGGEIRSSGSLPASNLRLTNDEALLCLFRSLPREVESVGAFLAGCATAADRARLSALVRTAWPSAKIAVGSDRDSGFATAFRDGEGIAVIAGTGSAVTGRRAGAIEKAGGWGQLLGDRGGGYNLAVQALRRVLESYDIEHRVTPLGENVLRTLSLNRLEELVEWASNADKMSVARLAPVVFDAAKRGDEEMTRVIQNGAKMLTEFTCAVAGRLGMESPEVKLMGGLFVHHAEYTDLFRDYFSDMVPGARVELCAESGARGAAWLASGAIPPAKASQARADVAELSAATTEQRNPRSANLDQLSTAELVNLFIEEEQSVGRALAAMRESICRAIEITGGALRAGGRLFYIGAGTSGRLGVLDASEIPPTFGAPPELVQGIIAGGARALHQAVEGAEDQAEQGAHAVCERGVGVGDVVCGITASGRTPFVLGALRQARELGARTMLLTCNPARKRAEIQWDAEIDLPTGPEIVTGSTRLKAGTATKLVLNMVSTCAMIRLGKVRGNLMVDLNVSNAKLQDRAVRLVSQTRGCSYDEARTLLERHEWNVRAAISLSVERGA